MFNRNPEWRENACGEIWPKLSRAADEEEFLPKNLEQAGTVECEKVESEEKKYLDQLGSDLERMSRCERYLRYSISDKLMSEAQFTLGIRVQG